MAELYDTPVPTPVVVWGEPSLRSDITALRRLRIATPYGIDVPLGDVAEVAIVAAPSEIKRESGSRRIDVTCNVRGKDIGSVARAVEARVLRRLLDADVVPGRRRRGQRHRDHHAPAGADHRRVARAIAVLEDHYAEEADLASLAAEAATSKYHFLRVFQRIAGMTPYQYLLQLRLRHAALALASRPGRIVDLALESGFRDLSGFNHRFRSGFGVTPREWRARHGWQKLARR